MPAFTFKSGWRPSVPDVRDKFLSFGEEVVATLPPANSRLDGFSEIWDQGPIGSCTAHAILRARNFAAFKAGMSEEMLSRLQLYYNERSDEGTTMSDAGAAIRTGIKTLQDRGCGLESLWPYIPGNYQMKPPEVVYQSALDHQLLKYAAVQPVITQIKAVLASGYPVIFGTAVYQSLELPTTASSGVIPIPRPREQQIGGHAIVFNGAWDDSRQLFGIDNSWGPSWGDAGRGWLPYWYVANGMVSDCWVLYQVEGHLPTPEPKPEPPPTPDPTPAPAPPGMTIPKTLTARDDSGKTIATYVRQ